VIPSSIAGIFPWLLPPVCGALVGFAFGVLVLRRLAISRLFRRRSEITRTVDGKVEALTRWGLGLRLKDFLPARGSPAAIALEGALARHLGGLLRSRSTIYAVRSLVSQAVSGAAARKVNEVAREIGVASFLSERVLPALGRLEGALHSVLPEAADALVGWLRSEETRAYLSERGRELLPRILERLSELQKLFISAGQFDRRLNEKMPEIVDDTIAAAERMVRDPKQQKRMVSQLTGLLENPAVRQSIAAFSEQRLLEDRRTVGAFFGDVFKTPDTELTDVLSARALEFLVRPESGQAIAGTVCGLLYSLVEENAQATVGETLLFDAEKKRSLDQALKARVPRFVEGLLPTISRELSLHARTGLVSAVIGAGMGFSIGIVLAVLRLLGIQ